MEYKITEPEHEISCTKIKQYKLDSTKMNICLLLYDNFYPIQKNHSSMLEITKEYI